MKSSLRFLFTAVASVALVCAPSAFAQRGGGGHRWWWRWWWLFTAAVVAAVSTAAGATAEEAVTIARLAAAAMVAVIAGATVEAIAAAITAAIIIPCRPAAPTPRDVPAIPTIHPRTADTAAGNRGYRFREPRQFVFIA